MKVAFRPAVAADLGDIRRFIAKDNTGRAVTFVAELLEKCRAIGERPRIGRLRPEIGEGIRSRAFRSYVILYRIEIDRVRILRVVHVPGTLNVWYSERYRAFASRHMPHRDGPSGAGWNSLIT